MQDFSPETDLSPSDFQVADCDDETLLKLYRTMRMIREFELAAKREANRGNFPGPVHLYLGQEAIAAGACQSLAPDDIIGSTHRGHGHVLAQGADPEEMMAELGGKETGTNGGRGGSMHIVDFSEGIFGTNGMVGASVPHVAGGILSAQLDGEDVVGIAFFGDGGANQGVVLETMNLASQWDLPVVFLCENNRYGISTPVTKSTAGDQISDRAEGFGMPGKTIDGQNVVEVYRVVSEAVRVARNDGPQFVEALTYRREGHFVGEKGLFEDGTYYRDDQEVQAWIEQCDPIEPFGKALIEGGIVDIADLESIDYECETQIAEAVEAMESAAYPPDDETFADTYSEQDYTGFPAPKYR